jgi:hypothetical protein
LDSYGVGDFAHDAAERVDFPDEMAFGDAADGGVAGHLRDEIDVQSEEGGLQAHAGGGHGGFASGVSGADYYYVEMFVELLHVLVRGPHYGGSATGSIVAIFCGKFLRAELS